MFKGFIAILSILCLASVAGADESLVGQSGVPYGGPQLRPEMLYRGDLIPELGIGCSNGYGTSGGPNDIAVRVTATTTPPFCLTSTYYNMYTNVAPYITALSFVCWTAPTATAPPGTEFARQGGLPWAQGNHTAALNPPIIVANARFFFGQNQPQTNVGVRWGLDQTTGGGGHNYIKAPGCGLASWGTMESIGYSGNWCMSVSVAGPSPAELQSWGQIKSEPP